MARLNETGRFVDPSYIINDVDSKPDATYEALKSTGLLRKWESYDNDVPRGAKPRLRDSGQNRPGRLPGARIESDPGEGSRREEGPEVTYRSSRERSLYARAFAEALRDIVGPEQRRDELPSVIMTRESWRGMGDDAKKPEWSPVPLSRAREFLAKHEDAQVEFIFPSVYEEDRTRKLQDLSFLEQTKVITHRRFSEQSAKEIGIENYDFDEEQEQIEEEQATAASAVPPESGGGSGGAVRALAVPADERRGPVAGAASDHGVTREDVDGPDARASFRRMRGVEASAGLAAEVRALAAAVARIAARLGV